MGHWGLDGLKSGMRYNLMGGYQFSVENVLGLNHCEGRAERSVEAGIHATMDLLMGSPEHQSNILNPHHHKVNIGIAGGAPKMMSAVQQFESDYVRFDRLPRIKGGNLSMSGSLVNGADFRAKTDIRIQIYYDPPPRPLTRGQLSMTYCEDPGVMVATLRPPLSPRMYYPANTFEQTYQRCLSPYDVAADTPAPESARAAKQRWRENSLELPDIVRHTVPWVTASQWETNQSTFNVSADLKDILTEHGEGVYSIYLWARAGRALTVVSTYSIFYEGE